MMVLFRRWNLGGALRCVAVLSLCTVLLTGCGTNLLSYYFDDLFDSGDTAERTPEQLAWDGMEAMRAKKYGKALEAFQKLKERYPYSKYAILAELKVGDAHYYKKDYEEAALAYEEFVRLHPRNEAVPYVLYQLGMSQYLISPSMDRDQDQTRKAMETFQRLMELYPNTEYAAKAQAQLFECEKRIAAHEYRIARMYYNMGKYRAAQQRLTRLLEDYPKAVEKLGYGKDIEKILAESEKRLERQGDGKSVWTRLGF